MRRKKILVIKIGAIGDVVMALPILSRLKDQDTTCHITWVCGKIVAPLLEATGLVDKLIILEESMLFSAKLAAKFFTFLRLQKGIGFRSYDHVIIAHRDFRYQVLCFLSFRKKTSIFSQHSSTVYHARIYQQMATGSYVPNSFPKVVLPSIFNDLKTPFVVLAPGGAKNPLADDFLRRWPVTYYVEVAKRLLQEGLHVLLTGSIGDDWVNPFFQKVNVESWIGKLSLLQTVALYKQACLLITHDSGPMHLAKLAPCLTIALFGPTDPKEKVEEPWIHVLWGGKKLSCRPCYDGKSYAKCTNNICLHAIQPFMVVDKALELLLTSTRI